MSSSAAGTLATSHPRRMGTPAACSGTRPQELEAVVSAWAARLARVPEGMAVLSYVQLALTD